jgi:hypothetical protein
MTNDADYDWRERLEYLAARRRRLLDQKHDADHPETLARVAFERCAIAAAVPEFRREAGRAFAEGGGFTAAAVIVASMAEGSVIVESSDLDHAVFPAGGPSPGPDVWLAGYAAALVARDRDALEVLCHVGNLSAALGRASSQDPFWPLLCAALAALALDPDQFEHYANDAEALLAPGNIDVADPEAIALQVAPVLQLARAVHAGQGIGEAVAATTASNQRFYETRDLAGDTGRLISLPCLGLASLAHDRGHAFEMDSLPAGLVRGTFERELLAVAFHFPARRATLATDPVGALDLYGFPTEQRTHTTAVRDDALVARYALRRPGLTAAVWEFVLEGGGGALPPALDAGERVLLSEVYAQAGAELIAAANVHGAKPWISAAVDQLEATLSLTPESERSVPPRAFVNPLGRSVYQREPDRFSRARLTAARDALTAMIAGADGIASVSAHAGAIAAAEVVRDAVRPMLEQFPSTEIVARLQPRAEDYGQVFAPAAALVARDYYEPLWQKGQLKPDPPESSQIELHIYVSPAGMFEHDNELSRPFPEGMRQIASLLTPERVWVAWRYTEPGERAGLSFDGLVWCSGRWVWFPKPHRAVGHLLQP